MLKSDSLQATKAIAEKEIPHPHVAHHPQVPILDYLRTYRHPLVLIPSHHLVLQTYLNLGR